MILKMILASILILTQVRASEENVFKKIYEVGNEWDEGFGGTIHAPVEWGTNLTEWFVEIKFVGAKLDGFQCWNAIIDSQTINVSKNETEFKLINNEHNGKLKEGEYTDIGFTAKKFKGDPVPAVMIKFNDKIIENQLDPTFVYVPDSKPVKVITTNEEGANVTTTDVDDAISDLRDDLEDEEEVDEDEEKEDEDEAEVIELTTNEEIAEKLDFNYKDVVSKSILFYAAQRSGRLPENNKVHWRGNSALYDKATSFNNTEVDLTGGYYDAGDFLKLGFPLAYSMTTLAWGTLHYWDAYLAMGNLADALETIKWGVDWIVKSVVLNKETGAVAQIFVQVDTKESHNTWDRPESIVRGWPRPAFSITKDKPGTDIASEYAAALASAHLVFKRALESELFENEEFVNKLRNLAKKIWTFSESAKIGGKGVLYSDSVPEAKKMYPSSHYHDERAWALLWLYRATGDTEYYDDARMNIERHKLGSQTAASHMFSWDDKQLGVQLLAAQVTRAGVKLKYLRPLLMYCANKEAKKTSGGLWWVSEWAPNRYAANSAFLCLMASEYRGDDTKAKRQAESGKKFASYVVGFGEKWAKRPHHRGASCPAQLSTGCNDGFLKSPNPNPSILFGALVGGPDAKDNYADDRTNYQQSEVALDYNSCFQGLMAGLFYHGIFEEKPIKMYSSIAPEDLKRNTLGKSSEEDDDSGSTARPLEMALAVWLVTLLH